MARSTGKDSCEGARDGCGEAEFGAALVASVLPSWRATTCPRACARASLRGSRLCRVPMLAHGSSLVNIRWACLKTVAEGQECTFCGW